MTKLPHTSPSRGIALLAAALELRRIHGIAFAIHFLNEYNFDKSVIRELLGLFSTGS